MCQVDVFSVCEVDEESWDEPEVDEVRRALNFLVLSMQRVQLLQEEWTLEVWLPEVEEEAWEEAAQCQIPSLIHCDV